jgi:hypothetical protein
MRVRLAAALVILGCSPLRADVEVRMAGDRVSVRAVSAPVAEILERLARATGMRVVYEGPVPRQVLTATLEGRAPAAVVLSVLEGLGLNYALVMDRSGARVDQLLILGAVAPGSASPLSTPPVARRGVPIVQPESPEELLESLQNDADAEQTESDEGDEFIAQLPPDQPPPDPAGPRPAGPPPPDYPSSAFTPRLPLPTPAPVPSPQASPPPPPRQ